MTHPAAPASTDDLAYIRQLAESGARAPLIGGRFMAWWGLLITLAWTAQHFAINGALGGDGSVYAIIWISYSLLGIGGQAVLARGMPALAGAGSAGNLAARSVWAAGGAAIAAMVAGAIALAAGGAGPQPFDWIVALAFAVYACALIVTGRLAGDRVAIGAGCGAVAMVGLYTALIFHPDRYLVAAAGGAATVLLPGLLLLAREPKARGTEARV